MSRGAASVFIFVRSWRPLILFEVIGGYFRPMRLLDMEHAAEYVVWLQLF